MQKNISGTNINSTAKGSPMEKKDPIYEINFLLYLTI